MRGLTIAAILLAGAGCKKTLHFRIVEDELHAKLGEAAPMASATCDESEVRPGATFPCHLVFKDGGATDVHVELVDTLGSWRMRETYVSAAHAAELIHDGLKKHDVDAAIECGKGLLVTGHHRCTGKATDGSGGALDFEVHDDGKLSWRPIE